MAFWGNPFKLFDSVRNSQATLGIGSDSDSEEEEEEEKVEESEEKVTEIEEEEVSEDEEGERPLLKRRKIATLDNKRNREVKEKEHEENDKEKKKKKKKKRSFERLWTKEDEITILKGMCNFGKDPLLNLNEFQSSIKQSLTYSDAPASKLRGKIHKLKNKYRDTEIFIANPISNQHDRIVYQLSKKVWGLDCLSDFSTGFDPDLFQMELDLVDDETKSKLKRDWSVKLDAEKHKKLKQIELFEKQIVLKYDAYKKLCD